MEKIEITSMMDYLKLKKELESGKGFIETEELLTILTSDKIAHAEKVNEIAVAPFGTGDMVAVITHNTLPIQFPGLAIDADFNVAILTTAHFGFLFAFKGDKQVFVYSRS